MIASHFNLLSNIFKTLGYILWLVSSIYGSYLSYGVMIKAGVDAEEAKQKLIKADGFVRKAIEGNS